MIAVCGITERGDAGLDFSWVSKLDKVDMATIITKNINDELIDNIIKNKNKIILHATVTGYGGNKLMEPNVPLYTWSIKQLEKLISYGFPVEQIVLRIDPIVPTTKGLNIANNVLEGAKELGVKRCRISFLDVYHHVAERMLNAGMKPPYLGNQPTKKMMEEALAMLTNWESVYDFEACAEYLDCQVGCISKKDLDVLKIDKQLNGKSHQREDCLCPGNKLELLSKARRCPHKCIYCYWKD